MNKICYCDTGNNSEECCLKFLSGKETPKTALELMRSRYTAFVLQDKKYLLNTWYKKKEKDLGDQLFNKDLKWISLEIINTQNGTVNDQTGFVEFKATFELKGQQTILQENSKFKKERGLWFYINGTHK